MKFDRSAVWLLVVAGSVLPMRAHAAGGCSEAAYQAQAASMGLVSLRDTATEIDRTVTDIEGVIADASARLEPGERKLLAANAEYLSTQAAQLRSTADAIEQNLAAAQAACY